MKIQLRTGFGVGLDISAGSHVAVALYVAAGFLPLSGHVDTESCFCISTKFVQSTLS